jgi:hypothetical protein
MNGGWDYLGLFTLEGNCFEASPESLDGLTGRMGGMYRLAGIAGVRL